MENNKQTTDEKNGNAAAPAAPVAADKKESVTHDDGSKTIYLMGGKVAHIKPFKGKHVMQAQRLIDGDSEKMVFALISMLTTIDDQPIVMEDMEEMPGADVFKLMAEFGTSNF